MLTVNIILNAFLVMFGLFATFQVKRLVSQLNLTNNTILQKQKNELDTLRQKEIESVKAEFQHVLKSYQNDLDLARTKEIETFKADVSTRQTRKRSAHCVKRANVSA